MVSLTGQTVKSGRTVCDARQTSVTATNVIIEKKFRFTFQTSKATYNQIVAAHIPAAVTES